MLFRSHSDLLTEFTYFLPDNSPPQVSRHSIQQEISSRTARSSNPAAEAGLHLGQAGQRILAVSSATALQAAAKVASSSVVLVSPERVILVQLVLCVCAAMHPGL